MNSYTIKIVDSYKNDESIINKIVDLNSYKDEYQKIYNYLALKHENLSIVYEENDNNTCDMYIYQEVEYEKNAWEKNGWIYNSYTKTVKLLYKLSLIKIFKI